MIRKYYYEIVKVWHLVSWSEECEECGEFSKDSICMNCGAFKRTSQEEVQDRSLLKDLNTFNREIVQRREAELEKDN